VVFGFTQTLLTKLIVIEPFEIVARKLYSSSTVLTHIQNGMHYEVVRNAEIIND